MKGHLMLIPAAVSCAAFFGAAGPVAAKEYEVCRGEVISYMLGWSFDTMGQCQAMSFGVVVIASAILFSMAPSTPARRLPTSTARDNKGSAPLRLATASLVS